MDSGSQKTDKLWDNLSNLLFHFLINPFFPEAHILFPAFILISALNTTPSTICRVSLRVSSRWQSASLEFL